MAARSTVSALGVALACAMAAAGAAGQGAPYYRFWHGKKLSNISYDEFIPVINRFIADTTNLGRGVALIGYVPTLARSPAANADYSETALVVYSSEAAYKKLMTSPAGVAYQKSHWGLFNESASSSKVPVPWQGSAAIGTAYDVLGSAAMWGSASAYMWYHPRDADISDDAYVAAVASYCEALKAVAATGQLLSLVVRVDVDALYDYSIWTSVADRTSALKGTDGLRAVKAALQFSTSDSPGDAVFAPAVDGANPSQHNITWGWGESMVLPIVPPVSA